MFVFLFVLVFYRSPLTTLPLAPMPSSAGGIYKRGKKEENQTRKGLITPRLRAIIGGGVYQKYC